MTDGMGFLAGGGVMGALVRSHDWTATPFGPPEHWPQSLRTMVSVVLNTDALGTILWGPELRLLYNDRYAEVLEHRHPSALGQPMMDVWGETTLPLLEPFRRVMETGEAFSNTGQDLPMLRNGKWVTTWWNSTCSPIRGENGDIVGLFNLALETTSQIEADLARDAAEAERVRVAAELAERGAFLSSVLQSSTDCIKVLELDGRVSFMSDGGMKVMNISDFNDVKGCPWQSFLKGDGPDQARKAIAAAQRGETTHFEAPADTHSGDPKHWSISVSPIRDGVGEVARILAVSRDHTHFEKAREVQALLNGELAHRIKNTMSIVQAIANQTLGKSEDQEAVVAFSSRLSALASANEVLTRESFSGATIAGATEGALTTFGLDRFTIDGPEVTIGPRATLALTLMLHELATNAVKYGALSSLGGHIIVSWRVRHEQDRDVFDFTWTERGGPPAVEPTRKGFGSRVIRMGLSGSGGVQLNYANEGLTVRATAPLYQLQEA